MQDQFLRDVAHWQGETVFDQNGEKIGSVDDIYYDRDTQVPEWARVTTGLFGTRHTIVPVTEASRVSDGIQVPFEKSYVKDAPNVDADVDLSQQEEAMLSEYYGISYTEDRSSSGLPDGGRAGDASDLGRDTSGPTTDDAMTRSEEEMRVRKHRRPSGLVRLRKEIVTEHEQVTVPVQREEVRIEREPITAANADRAMSGPELSSEEHEMVLNEEEVEVTKRVVPKERVRLDKDVVAEEQTVDEELRKERIDVEREGRSRT
jgi:uncharacterized protein (TIGR02271 family)